MNSTIGIKVNRNAPLAKVAPIIRKYRPLSISDIKEKINTGEYIISCEYTDDIELNNILHCYRQLQSIGVSASLFEHDRACDFQLLKNLSSTYKEISEMIDKEIEQELKQEENL